MSDINVIALQGRLTKDPEVKPVGDKGTSLCTFSIANNQFYGGANKTWYYNCEAWGKTADNIAKFFTKGKLIFISGKLKHEVYEKDGKNNHSYKIAVNEFSFGDTKKAGIDSMGNEVQSAPEASYDDFPI